ncbi:MAG TPA: hypothetical protein VMX36_11435, partial [Sedimentisphaerales bacterium]|nr:hypothetical protein [Sedimentisphaerales bacterium]
LHAQTIPSTALRASPEPVEGTGPKAYGFEAATRSMQNSPSLRDEAATQSSQAYPSQRDEAATRRLSAEKKGDLKKQTQFAPDEIGAKSFLKGDYENKPAGGVEENKAKQSQFHAPTLTKGAGKKEKLLAAADSLIGISSNS